VPAKKVLGVGLALAGVVSLHAEATLLPELAKHREFAQKAAELGNHDALRAATEVLVLKRVTYRLPEDTGAAERQAFTEAIQQWERYLSRDITFVEAFKFQQADVDVSWVTALGGNGQHYGGFTRWKRTISQDSKGRYVADVDAKMQIRTMQPNGQPMSLEHMRHAIMHEFGHILGLDDSKRVGDVMGPLDLGKPVVNPNKDEVDELKRLRAEVRALRAAER
jgi:hypothetical protein